MAQQNGTPSNDFTVKAGLAQMLKGGVIMDVVNAEQVCGLDAMALRWSIDGTTGNPTLTSGFDTRLALLRRPALPPSWLLNACPLIFVLRVALPVCLTLP